MEIPAAAEETGESQHSTDVVAAAVGGGDSAHGDAPTPLAYTLAHKGSEAGEETSTVAAVTTMTPGRLALPADAIAEALFKEVGSKG